MVGCNGESLTEAEAALYDRQIRLWGLDAQKRLRAANVLVAGACGLGAEVIKNLVLAGVKSLCILDHRSVTEIDTVANFLAPHDSIGKNIAESSRERAQALNPMVSVTTSTENIFEKSEDFFKNFTVVCLFRCSKRVSCRVNNICHQYDIKFYSGDVFGMYGHMFADLGEHTYVEEVKEKVETELNGRKEMIEETNMIKRIESFIPLLPSLEVDWTSQKYGMRLKRTVSDYFIMLVLQEFEAVHNRRPETTNRESDIVELLTIKNSFLNLISIPQTKISNDFAQHIFGQVSPVCAIVGGIIAQEVIKAVSQKDIPLNNFFFFNPDICAGSVECIGQ